MEAPTPNTYQTTDRLDLVTSHEWYPVLVCDWRTGDIDVTSKHESQGSWMPMDQWHGHMSSYTLPGPTDAVALSKLIREHLRPLVDRVVGGYESKWDGRNLVAVFDDTAFAARDDISDLLEWHSDALVLHEGGYYGPADYLAGAWQDLPVTAESTDEDLEALADELVVEARDMSCVLDQHLTFRYVKKLRSEYRLDLVSTVAEN